MISLEKYGDTTYVDWSKSTPNSLSNGIVIELRWTFIEIYHDEKILIKYVLYYDCKFRYIVQYYL
jgi:hypothetical protein